jgi:hypothetical protein
MPSTPPADSFQTQVEKPLLQSFFDFNCRFKAKKCPSFFSAKGGKERGAFFWLRQKEKRI